MKNRRVYFKIFFPVFIVCSLICPLCVPVKPLHAEDAEGIKEGADEVQLSEEEMGIIENLELLESLEMFETDMNFWEDYEMITAIETQEEGGHHEK